MAPPAYALVLSIDEKSQIQALDRTQPGSPIKKGRLAGTAAVREVGRDPTGSIVGSHASSPEAAAAVLAVYERVFATAHPIFATGEFKVMSGAIMNMSLLTLPLSDDGADVNMAVFLPSSRAISSVSRPALAG